ncbi:MAG TPA: hypothetical protein VMD92_10345 [Acidobacteriaceae bacterium]|nr:hypothetical protein [Acidobacteriaceae bacterium]
MLILLILSALYFFSFFNRFAGLRSGNGEFGGGMALLTGRLPYRDFFNAGPPLNMMKAACELWLFGKLLIVTRTCAVLERLTIAAILYAWLRRTFSSWASCIAALVTIIVSAGDRTDPLASYNHDAILFAMLCGFAAGLSLERPSLRNMIVLAFASGFAAGLSALTKQTVGLGTAVAIAVIGTAACLRLLGLRRSSAWLAFYLTGISVPILAVAAFLAHLGVLSAALHMMFVSGPHAKATTPGMFVLREIGIASTVYRIWFFLGLAGLVLGARVIWTGLHNSQPAAEAEKSHWRWLTIGGLVVVGTAEVLALTSLPALHDFSKSSVYFTFLGTTFFGLALADIALRGRSDSGRRIWQMLLLAATGWSVAFTLSLSFPAFEAMTLPGLGLLLAAAVDGAQMRSRVVLYCVMTCMVYMAVREKLDDPFAFDFQDEPPVRFATHRSALPALRGMRLPEETVQLLDETVPAMQAAAASHEPVFTYPEMGILYALSGGNPPTFAASHNIDVVSDDLARQDAARLLQNPPAVILYARPDEAALHLQDVLWRGGKRSGQRDLVAALDRLVGHDIPADTFVLRTGDPPIRLYVRGNPRRQPSGP